MSTRWARSTLAVAVASVLLCLADLLLGAPGWMGWIVAAGISGALACTQVTTLAHLRIIATYAERAEFWRRQAERAGRELFERASGRRPDTG